MTILHMQTESVRAMTVELLRTAEEIRTQMQSISGSVQSVEWIGSNHDQFIEEIQQIIQGFTQKMEDGDVLARRVQNEVDEWEQIDQKFLNSSVNLISFVIIPPLLPIFFGGHKIIPSQPVDQLNERWTKMNQAERIQYLQQQYNELAVKYELKPITLVAEDLPDEKFLGITLSDSKGGFREARGELVIDIDNLKSDKGYSVLQTLIHETRHQIQAKMVDLYRSKGENATFPEGISLSRVKEWDQNFKNYITPENDYEGYRKQVIEVDSREFAQNYSNELVKNEYFPEGIVQA